MEPIKRKIQHTPYRDWMALQLYRAGTAFYNLFAFFTKISPNSDIAITTIGIDAIKDGARFQTRRLIGENSVPLQVSSFFVRRQDLENVLKKLEEEKENGQEKTI